MDIFFVSTLVLSSLIFIELFLYELFRRRRRLEKKFSTFRIMTNWCLIIIFFSSLIGLGVLKISDHKTLNTKEVELKTDSPNKKKTKSISKIVATTSSEESPRQENSTSEPAVVPSVSAEDNNVQNPNQNVGESTKSSFTEEEYWEDGPLTSSTVPYSYSVPITVETGSHTEIIEPSE
ncbi:hypothetical protein QLT07_05010 [Streptococcus equi subsp. zooepidemicus]|uniref:hypothetical protein n=1 Tax=Streptococcus equi TaxID=1336 RepID=UPI0024A9E5C9|nr:hypothetical protein [Streptococcus equi]MDI6043934.1 hypothetical protein [Streptococcus equi subsp. zooepidemicus]HEL0024057.1 hypothetical protein [Streptococcus equi subsp. zooepidemicus]